jgi:cytochrome c-type biogenesis protein CcmH/NrfF
MRRLLPTLLTLALIAAPASAAQPRPRTSLNDIENEVMCLVCGTPLNVADSPQADQERAFIRRLIAKGDTKQQVKDALVAQFGRRILDVPSGHGFDLAAYLVPALAILLAGGVISVAVVRWRRDRTPALAGTSNGGPPSSDDRSLLTKDLERYDL